MQILKRLGPCFGHSTHPHAVSDVPGEQGTIVAVAPEYYHKGGVCSLRRRGDGGFVSQGGMSSVSPLPQPCCSSDGFTDLVGSDDEEESQGLLMDDLPDEILENVMYQLRKGMSDWSQRSGKHGLRMTREDVRSLLAVGSVSRKWREMAQRIFFASPWDINERLHTFTYQHPVQMFCASPVGPKGSRSGLVKCFVKRHRMDETGGRLVISMYIGKYQSSRVHFMMSAVGRGRSSYEIYLEHAHKAHVQEPCARLECNMLCTSYSLKLSDVMHSYIKNNIATRDCESPVEKNVLSLQYRARMRGIMQPRRMEVSLPRGLHQTTSHTLYNKHPHWNEGLNCWCLNFRGRVKLASVKNFQLVHQGCEEDFDEAILMQFGKIDDDVFILDFNPTIMTPIQAFGTALSTFNGRVLGLRH